MATHNAQRRRGETLVVTTLALLVLVIATLVALSVRDRASEKPPVTNFVQISDQGRPTVDPFATDPDRSSGSGPAQFPTK